MLKDGYYEVKLNGPFGQGVGIVVLENERIRGGDDLLIYEGSFHQNSDAAGHVKIEADLSAKIYRADSAQRGQVFNVKCNGKVVADGFEILGRFVTGEAVNVKGNHIAGLKF
jgi:hypothetical protein